MTKITIFAATELEIAPVVSYFGDRFAYCVTGVGSAATAVAVMQNLVQNKPNLALQVGIAGAIDHSLAIAGSVVVSRDYVADMGAFRDGNFVQFESEVAEYPYVTDGFRNVTARTVNAACTPYIKDDAQIETMEGAAFMMAARTSGVRFMQIRTISNYIDTPRAEWQIERAVAALPPTVARLLGVEI